MQVLLLVGIVSCVCEAFQPKTYSVAIKDSIAHMCVCACVCSTNLKCAGHTMIVCRAQRGLHSSGVPSVLCATHIPIF